MSVCLTYLYNCNGSTQSNQVNSCLDESACNYMDNNSCLYKDCNGECGGSAVEDSCGICDGDGSTCGENWNVYYDISIPIGGFQFRVNNVTLNNVYGGAAGDAGFNPSYNEETGMVLGFSFTGATIPAGSNNILTTLVLEGDNSHACLADPVISNAAGDGIDVEIIDCQTIREKE